jgi:protein-L-isoaspartate O-methyltransferase
MRPTHATPSKRERATADRFAQRYGENRGDAGRAIIIAVFGANIDVNGYTTVAQAKRLADALKLRPGMVLLDVGAGAGWPGLHIAKVTGCDLVTGDQPRPALMRAVANTGHYGLDGRCSVVQVTATRLPFASSCFDAIVHADVMC